MNLLADEGVDKQIVDRLRSDGHTVTYVAEVEPGVPDNIVLEWANKEKALLVTTDKDFGELVFRMRQLSTGIVLIRLSGLPSARKAEIVSSLIAQHSQDLISAFSVVTIRGTRIRQKSIL